MSQLKFITEIPFYDVMVKIYFDPSGDSNYISCVWRMRNPETCYTGYMYLSNETGKLSYPPDAIIPEQTERDREIMPQFMITGKNEITTDDLVKINTYLDLNHKIRNGKLLN